MIAYSLLHNTTFIFLNGHFLNHLEILAQARCRLIAGLRGGQRQCSSLEGDAGGMFVRDYQMPISPAYSTTARPSRKTMVTRRNQQVPVDPPAPREKDLIEYFWGYFWEDPDPELEDLGVDEGEVPPQAKKSTARRSKHNHPTKHLAGRRRVRKDSRELATVQETSRGRAFRPRAASPFRAAGSSSDNSDGGFPEEASIREASLSPTRNRSIRSIKTLDTFDFVPGCRIAPDYFVNVEGTPNSLLSCDNPADYTFSERKPHSELTSQPVLSRDPTMVASHLKDDIAADTRLRRMAFVPSEQRDDEEDVTLFKRLFGTFLPPEEQEGAQGGVNASESLSPRQHSFVWSNRSDLIWADRQSDINPKNRATINEASRFPNDDHEEQFGGGESATSSRKLTNKQLNELNFGQNSKPGTETYSGSDMTLGRDTDRYSEGLPSFFSPWRRIESHQSGFTSVGIPRNPIKNESDNNSMKAVGDDCPLQEEQETPEPGPEPQPEKHDEILHLALSEFTDDDTTVRHRPGLLSCRKGNLRELEAASLAETAQMSNTFKRLSCKRTDGNFDDDTSPQDIPDGYSNAGRDSILLLQLEPKKKDDFRESILVNQMKSKGKINIIPRRTCGRSGGFDGESLAESELSLDLGKKCALRPRWKGKNNYDISTPLPMSIKQKPSVTFADESTTTDTLPDFSHDDAASLRDLGRMKPHFRENTKTPEISNKTTPVQTPIAVEPAQIPDPVASFPEKAKRAEKARKSEPQASLPEKAKRADRAEKPEPRASIPEAMPGRSTRPNIPEKSGRVARAPVPKKSDRAANPGKTESAEKVVARPPRSEHRASRNEKPTRNNRTSRTARDRGDESGSIAAHSHYEYNAPRLPKTLPSPRHPKTLPSSRPKSLPKTLPKKLPPKTLPPKTLPSKTLPKRGKSIRPRVMDPPKTKERSGQRFVDPVHPFFKADSDDDDDDDEDFTSGNESDDGDDYDEDDESYESQTSLYDRLGAIQPGKYSAFNIQQSSWEADDYSLDAMTKFSQR